MDMPVNVPVDDPNADTEWYALESAGVALRQAETPLGTIYCASMVLFRKSRRLLRL